MSVSEPSPAVASGRGGSLPAYFPVALMAGAVIALQIAIMRIFAVGSWVHFGSLVVSLAMLGFGLASALMCIGKIWFERHWRAAGSLAMLMFGPLAVATNLLAQQVPFNAIFLISDPEQKWRLFANFILYFLPFLAGAFFLGIAFLKNSTIFGRVYFADLAGSGLCGLLALGSMYVLKPDDLIVVPLLLWFAAGALWFIAQGTGRGLSGFALLAAIAVAAHLILPDLLGIPKLAVSDYKGVAYARKFPDSRKIYENVSPFGDLEVYSSSYLHFAPGLSDNAAFNLPEVPANAYLGLYVDGEGPSGIIRNLTEAQTGYFRYLPMYYPYVLKQGAKTFVVQFSGGISTEVALRSGSKTVTVAEANPAVLEAFRTSSPIREFTGDLLSDPRVTAVDSEGRLFLAHTSERYDVIDLSLVDSTGLSSPGGFAIVEKYPYTREALGSYMRALSDGGILAVTLWNKEEPPKSVLKFYATAVAAARDADPQGFARSLYAASSYLSTCTVLFKRGGFSAEEIRSLRGFTHALSFDDIYYPGMSFDTTETAKIIDDYEAQIFGQGTSDAEMQASDPPLDAAGGDSDAETESVPATTMGRLAWHYLIGGGWPDIASRYVFDTRLLTNDRPYFAAYVKPADLLRITDRLELFQDDWGYLLLWAALAIACACASVLVAIPLLFGWRSVFGRTPGKFGTIVYFACLGFGYIATEVGLIAKFVLALSNATISATILITGMLVFSGLGSLCSERIVERARSVMPVILAAIALLLVGYSYLLDPALDWIGALPYVLRLFFCFVLIFPPAFLMGFPMPTAMTSLGRLDKEHMFIWAWGINGCFSVIGAAAVPIISTSFGIAAVLQASGVAYLLAVPALLAVLLPQKMVLSRVG